MSELPENAGATILNYLLTSDSAKAILEDEPALLDELGGEDNFSAARDAVGKFIDEQRVRRLLDLQAYFEFEGMAVQAYRSSEDGMLCLDIETGGLKDKDEIGEHRIPRLRLVINESEQQLDEEGQWYTPSQEIL